MILPLHIEIQQCIIPSQRSFSEERAPHHILFQACIQRDEGREQSSQNAKKSLNFADVLVMQIKSLYGLSQWKRMTLRSLLILQHITLTLTSKVEILIVFMLEILKLWIWVFKFQRKEIKCRASCQLTTEKSKKLSSCIACMTISCYFIRWNLFCFTSIDAFSRSSMETSNSCYQQFLKR